MSQSFSNRSQAPTKNGLQAKATQATQAVADKFSQVAGNAQEQARALQHRATDTVQEYPLPTVLTFFGIGVGVGLLVGCKMVDAAMRSYSPPSYSRQWTDYGRDLMNTAWQHVPGSMKQ